MNEIVRLCAEHIPENVYYPTSTFQHQSFHQNDRTLKSTQVEWRIKFGKKRKPIVLYIGFSVWRVPQLRSIFHTSQCNFKTYRSLLSECIILSIHCTLQEYTTRSHVARDKTIIYNFAVLFIECLTFLLTFVHTIIFMYYVTKGDRAGLSQQARTRAQE